MIRQWIRRSAFALTVATFVLAQVTGALAGTTGGMSGIVAGEDGAPIAGVSVKAVSVSQVATTTTDATGHFNFLALQPDTYTVALEKDNYAPLSYAGVTIFADNHLALSFRMEKQLKTIKSVTARAAGDLVKSGVGGDVYNVNSAAISSASALGGGGNLNSAYSAIASVPGVVVPTGGAGWMQPTYVRGAQTFFTGFEYDGIPVNRAFDNYNSSTESNLGLQELQVYSGGGPSSNSSAGVSGFVNQVFKTGTYPGSATIAGGIGGPTFYHQAKVEVGGSTPDRRFSYYIGLSGYNQDFRLIDNSNGGDLTNSPLGIFTGQSTLSRGTFQNYGTPSIAGECNLKAGPNSASWDPNPLWNNPAAPWYNADNAVNGSNGSNCNIPFNGIYGLLGGLTDRESIANFHFKIPRKGGMSDDIQLLGSSSALQSIPYSSVNDAGGYAPYTLAVTGQPYCAPGSTVDVYGTPCTPSAGNNYPAYVDAYVYSLPFGTPVAGKNAHQYFQPSSNPNRAFDAQVPANMRDVLHNDTGVVKLQYTHQINANAFARVFGYTFFSDWTQAGANSSFNCYQYGIGGPNDCGVAANYDLITHTAGGELQIVDQITPQHLLQLTGNYTTANVVRFNNSGFTGGAESVGLISNNNGVYTCYKASTGAALASCGLKGYTAGANPTGTYAPVVGQAAANGAQWVTLWNGDARGSYNTVRPRFGFASLEDQWRPNDKLLINAALRYDNYWYGMQADAGQAAAFYGQIIDSSVCQASNGQIYTKPLLPGQPPPAPVNYTTNCPAAFPNHPKFTTQSPSQYTVSDLSPRLSATYTQSPDTVWRGSIGHFTAPPISASLQYLNVAGDNRTVWNATLPIGFNSPFHPIPPQNATQADLSLERHVRGTDMSFKITPFYSYTVGYQEQSFIGPNFVTQVPVGNLKSTGVELALTKGDFSRDGLAGSLALTYTHARIQYTSWFGHNELDAVNQAITNYNGLTKGGGGSAFYCDSTDASGNQTAVGASSAAGCATVVSPNPVIAVTNPYFNSPSQNMLATNGWYPGADTGLSPQNNPSTTYFDVPWNMTMILNYRKNKFAITPSVQITEGSSYGGPLDIAGLDPRACQQTSAQAGITAVSPGTDPNQCDALSATQVYGPQGQELFIPNPQTGTFAAPGAFRNPWIAVGSVAMSYELSPKVTANLTLANLWHTCFGGTKASWTSAFPVGSNVCGYGPNGQYVSNYYNGTGINDTAANGLAAPAFESQPYTPRLGSDAGALPSPFNVFFTLNIKM